MKKNIRRIAIVVVFIIIALVTSACPGDDDSGNVQTGNQTFDLPTPAPQNNQ